MTVSTALVILSLTQGLSGAPSDAPAAGLTLQGDPTTPSPWTMDLTLRSERFFAQNNGRRAAPAPTTPAPSPAATPAAAQPAPAATGGGAADAPAAEAPAAEEASAPEQCDVDCEEAHEGQRMGRFVMRNRGRTLRTHRAFAIAAWSTMLVTEVLGTIQAVNQDTWFGRGNCASDPRAFGCENYSLIQGLHETFAFVTTGLYTTAGVLAVAAPDPENASVGEGSAESTLRLHKTLAYIHGAGMILLPVLGILSVTPQVFGITDAESRADFSRAMRSIHTVVGFSTFAAFTFAGVLEL